jgi:hypothetical protein
MNDQTTLAQYLQAFVDTGNASQEQVIAANEIFTHNWLNTLGDKKFTAAQLVTLRIPALVL